MVSSAIASQLQAKTPHCCHLHPGEPFAGTVGVTCVHLPFHVNCRGETCTKFACEPFVLLSTPPSDTPQLKGFSTAVDCRYASAVLRFCFFGLGSSRFVSIGYSLYLRSRVCTATGKQWSAGLFLRVSFSRLQLRRQGNCTNTENSSQVECLRR